MLIGVSLTGQRHDCVLRHWRYGCSVAEATIVGSWSKSRAMHWEIGRVGQNAWVHSLEKVTIFQIARMSRVAVTRQPAPVVHRFQWEVVCISDSI